MKGKLDRDDSPEREDPGRTRKADSPPPEPERTVAGDKGDPGPADRTRIADVSQDADDTHFEVYELDGAADATAAASPASQPTVANPTEIAATAAGVTGADTPAAADGSRQIGNYQLIRRIGEGGMGEVWEAEQVRPLRRRVAFKVIKVGMDNREFTARFESERQALAMMDHPYIASVFDAGTTERGRPFFVMEYVEGVPLTEHCNAQNYNIRERLELFIKVCEGIQHAHQKAIIHRDIKPSNVLVTIQEGTDWPKIIDFGVAKAIDKKLTDHTVHTEVGQFIGTPAYMSPEQIDMTGQNIDTRTDIYMLGVLLYELLTGVLPFDTDQLLQTGLASLLQHIQDVEPPRPSTRIDAMGEHSTEAASQRRLTVPKLKSQLKGDLDWITMKALEKDRARRYETANALIQDIKRYLRDEPVTAGPPSTSYRVKKFVKRHRTGVVAAGVVGVALVLGILGTSVGMIRAQRSERIANAEAETARQISSFMVGLFEVADPSEARGNSITAREILDKGVVKIETGLAEQPLTQARLMNTMGRVYKELGLYQEARPLLEQSLGLLAEQEAGDAPDAAVVMNDLGGLLREAGDFSEAQEHLENALAIRERELGPEDPDLAQSLNSYANLLWQTGQLEQAEAYYERSLAIRERALEPDDPDIAITLNNIGGLRMQAADYEAAQSYFERALEIRQRSLGEDHPDVARSLSNLGKLHWAMGDFETSSSYHEQSLALREKVFGPVHPIVATGLSDYAFVLEDMGEFDRARQMFERSIEIREQSLGTEHPDLAASLSNYAAFLHRRADTQNALAKQEQAVAIWEVSRGPEHPDVATGLNNLAIMQMQVGDFAGAKPNLQRALQIEEANFGSDHPEYARKLDNLGMVLTNLGEVAEARACHERSIAIWEKALGPDHPDVATGCLNLGVLLRNNGLFTEARPYLERSLAIREKALGPEHVDTARSLASLGLLAYFEGNHGAARTLCLRALEIQQDQLPQGHPELVENAYNLACLSALQGERQAALGYLQLIVDHGFANPYIEQDGDLASLHGDPEFERILQVIRERAGG